VDARELFEQLIHAPPDATRYVLRLYITGMSPRSTAAVAAIKHVCEEHLPGQYQLDVIDLYRDPAQAQSEQIVAAPTLVKQDPPPERRLVGNLSDHLRVLRGLNLAPHP
jgi:circadian clock protein KaiB